MNFKCNCNHCQVEKINNAKPSSFINLAFDSGRLYEKERILKQLLKCCNCTPIGNVLIHSCSVRLAIGLIEIMDK